MTTEELRTDLTATITKIIDAVGGEGSTKRIGFRALSEAGSEVPSHYQFWVIVDPRVKGAVIGKEGANAHRMRELVRTRATVLGHYESIDVRVVARETEAPAGAFAKA